MYVDIFNSPGNVQVLPQKTRLVCVPTVRFADWEARVETGLPSTPTLDAVRRPA